jgi:hypothetical protein
MNVRDDFPPAVKEILAKRVGFRCSNPVCGQLTSGPQVDATKAVNVGVAAHITAASAAGPRYDESLTPEERSHPYNGVWLCQKCGKLVDNDAIRYPEPLLREWKRQAEEVAIREVEGLPRCRPDAEPPWVDSGGRFERELEARNLSDPSSESFGKTRYSAWQAWVKGRRVIEPFPSTSIFFAWMPQPIVADASQDGLLRWMDCNERRYEPCRGRPFIPSLVHSLVPKGFIWDDSPQMYPTRCCCRYLALETTGWIEYGFYPGAEWEEQTDRIYYAKVVASFVAFLSFMRELAAQFEIDPAGMGLGVTLKGTAKKHRLGIREEGMRLSFQTQPPARDGFRSPQAVPAPAAVSRWQLGKDGLGRAQAKSEKEFTALADFANRQP